MSDLSTYFHLSVADAAKKLGVSQTTLKKACRKFGLKRWPGRKVINMIILWWPRLRNEVMVLASWPLSCICLYMTSN